MTLVLNNDFIHSLEKVQILNAFGAKLQKGVTSCQGDFFSTSYENSIIFWKLSLSNALQQHTRLTKFSKHCVERDPHWFSRESSGAAGVNYYFIFFWQPHSGKRQTDDTSLSPAGVLPEEWNIDELVASESLLWGSYYRGARDERTEQDLKPTFKCHYSERNVVNARADED